MSAALVMVCTGCNSDCIGACGPEPIPEVDLGGQSDHAGTVVAQDPNPCQIDVDFGTVTTGQQVTATIEIKNLGAGTLDLADVNPSLDPGFSLNYGTRQPILPGGYKEFSVTFRPYKAGQVQSTFMIQTDGKNEQCPLTPSSENIVTVQLTGTGASPDAGA